MPAHVFAQLLESEVLSEAAVARLREALAEEGVDIAAMMSPGVQAPMRWFRKAYPALDQAQASYLGYSAGEQARLTSYSLLSMPLVSAGSVNEVLRLLAFLPLISNAVSARFFERADAVLVILSANTGDPVLDRFPVFYCAAALVSLLKLLSNDTLDLSVHIAWPPPPDLVDHPECLAGRLHFNAPLHYIRVPRSTLEAVCRFSDPIAYANETNRLQAMLAQRSVPEEVVARVKHLLDGASGMVRINEIAQQLNVSVSTLKRRLASSHTSFSELLEGTLKDRAILMLIDTSMTLESIASALGYSDLANFSHAFKRWTDCSPGAYRRQSIAIISEKYA
ncbi:MAG: helix-turn-helix domain-containing protein [Paraperlucidibaca sp.]